MNIWIEYTYNFLRVSISKFSNTGAVWALLLDPEIKFHHTVLQFEIYALYLDVAPLKPHENYFGMFFTIQSNRL